MDTERLIQSLALAVKPVQALPRPWVRSVQWLTVAIPYLVLVVYIMSPRADLMAKIVDARYFIEQTASLVTGITASIAAFASTIPGYSRKILLLPVLSMTVWLGALAQGSISALVQFGFNDSTFQSDWFCLPAIVLLGVLPAVVMVVMLRRGAPLMPCTTVTLGALAVAGLGDFGLRFFDPLDASLTVLVWQFGSVFILAVSCGCLGRHILNWQSVGDASP